MADVRPCPLHKQGASVTDGPFMDEPDHICPVTQSYCTGQFCEDYGCAKEAGFYDDEDDYP